MKKSLPASTLQLMKDLMNEATASGELGDIEKKYFGSASDIAALEEMYFGQEEESEEGPDTAEGDTTATDTTSSGIARNSVAVLVVSLFFFVL